MSNQHIDNLTGVYEHTGTVISAVGAEQLELPTPRTDWNVRELLNHTIGVMFGIAGGVSGQPAPDGEAPDFTAGGGASAAFEQAKQASLAAWGMLLFCDQPSGGVNHIPPDEAAVYAELRAEAEARGAWVTGAALMSDERATRVRAVGGEIQLTDGPFAEVTDLLSGMFVVDFDSHEDALAFAARIPAASNGAVEVRRVLDHDPG